MPVGVGGRSDLQGSALSVHTRFWDEGAEPEGGAVGQAKVSKSAGVLGMAPGGASPKVGSPESYLPAFLPPAPSTHPFHFPSIYPLLPSPSLPSSPLLTTG